MNKQVQLQRLKRLNLDKNLMAFNWLFVKIIFQIFDAIKSFCPTYAQINGLKPFNIKLPASYGSNSKVSLESNIYILRTERNYENCYLISCNPLKLIKQKFIVSSLNRMKACFKRQRMTLRIKCTRTKYQCSIDTIRARIALCVRQAKF